MEKPNVFRYHNYLLFFQDWLSFKKDTSKDFSLRKWSQVIGVSPALVSQILKGKKSFTENQFYQFCSTMNLRKNERLTLGLLRIIAESANSEERITAYNSLLKVPEYRKQNIENNATFQFLTNWLNVALREMAFLPDFQAKVDWIKIRLLKKVAQKDIEKSLSFLIENQYLVEQGPGRWKPSQQNLKCSDGVYKLSLSEFHRTMFKLASDSIENTPRSERLILGHTLALTDTQLAQVHLILEEAISKIEMIKPSSTADQVIHIELASFPLTRKIERGTV